ncbi:MAG: sigma-70 family RNA polymerase sigma factor [Tepidisphaeraceae bacterium]
MSQTLAELFDRCRQRDRAALEEMIRRFEPYARSVARAFVSRDDEVDDVVQEALLLVFLHLDEVRVPAAFPAWVRQVVRRVAHRSRKTIRLLPDEDDVIAQPIDLVEAAELRQQVRSAVASLRQVNRDAADLFYLQELDQNAIADQLRVPLGTVKRRLHDARSALRTLLSDHATDLPE